MVHEDLAERETEKDKIPDLDPQLLPYPAVSVQWYVKQNKLAKHNTARDSIHRSMAVETKMVISLMSIVVRWWAPWRKTLLI